jgi:hypothetical protein
VRNALKLLIDCPRLDKCIGWPGVAYQANVETKLRGSAEAAT